MKLLARFHGRMADPKKQLKYGCCGLAVSGVCCFTPVLVAGMAAVGLGAYIGGWLDYILFPLMAAHAGIIIFALAAWRKSSAQSPILETTITCPQCGKSWLAAMPQNACQWFYDCAFCGALLRPKKGDCCVFCSYAKHQCPSMQKGGSCCN